VRGRAATSSPECIACGFDTACTYPRSEAAASPDHDTSAGSQPAVSAPRRHERRGAGTAVTSSQNEQQSSAGRGRPACRLRPSRPAPRHSRGSITDERPRPGHTFGEGQEASQSGRRADPLARPVACACGGSSAEPSGSSEGRWSVLAAAGRRAIPDRPAVLVAFARAAPGRGRRSGSDGYGRPRRRSPGRVPGRSRSCRVARRR